MIGKAPKKKLTSVMLCSFGFLYSWKIVPIGSPKTSIKNYHSTPRNISEEQISSHDLVMQDMLWLRVAPFRPIKFSTSRTN